MADKKYFDTDGERRTIQEMIKLEPEWVASRFEKNDRGCRGMRIELQKMLENEEKQASQLKEATATAEHWKATVEVLAEKLHEIAEYPLPVEMLIDKAKAEAEKRMQEEK